MGSSRSASRAATRPSPAGSRICWADWPGWPRTSATTGPCTPGSTCSYRLRPNCSRSIPTGSGRPAVWPPVLAQIADDATLHSESCATDLCLADVRHLLGRHLQGTAGRADFFRGGITVSSLTPLRGLPYRVICLLGMDEAGFTVGSPEGDDLTATDPHLGDRDRRADTRQALLETVLAADQHLVLLRSGHSVVTNQPVPAAVAVAEFGDVVSATIDDDVRDAHLAHVVIAHPRQSFDERNFLVDGAPSLSQRNGPWSFDPGARAGAIARSASAGTTPFLSAPAHGSERAGHRPGRPAGLPGAPTQVLPAAGARPPAAREPIARSRQGGRSSCRLERPTAGGRGSRPRARSRHPRVLGRARPIPEPPAQRGFGRILRPSRAGRRDAPARSPGDRQLEDAGDLAEKLLGALDTLGARAPSTERTPST